MTEPMQQLIGPLIQPKDILDMLHAIYIIVVIHYLYIMYYFVCALWYKGKFIHYMTKTINRISTVSIIALLMLIILGIITLHIKMDKINIQL